MRLRRNAPAALALDLSGNRRRPGWLGWVLLALGLLVLALQLKSLFEARTDLAERAAIVERLRAQAPAVSVTTAGQATDPLAASKVAAQLQADWAGVFGALGQAPDDEVGLLEVQIDVARGSVRLRGQARSLEAAFAYVEALALKGGLRQAHVDSHQWVEVGTMTVLEFSASARWGGGS
ncbi:hypothetical protein CJ010_02510 [Azoarcus sp. DD4]|uniref:hypothetical protein n=1 Tax=Azoarcus sp. DD4 TaxID=2027405 RepID=UPI00112E831A|nr:hypothetical protein [Azoarcus sp. DD4]QDF95502.1 hypothetical protein CJ010_02510 [Azoarcus sp. DD4]